MMLPHIRVTADFVAQVRRLASLHLTGKLVLPRAVTRDSE